MKKIYLSVAAALAISTAATAQCSGRYAADVYSVTTTTAITYGSNLDYTGAATTLTLDFYEPTSDTSHARPLIIWAHGGSFIGGTSADFDVTSLSQHFAKKGYACASINYRIGVSSFDSVGLNQAVVRAVQDLKASIRFFYKDRKTGANAYKIDTNNIFIGGSSAGAITVLHAEYLDRACKLYPYIDSTSLVALGGLDGVSGNSGYSTKVKGVIDLCGGLGVYTWLEAGNTPLCSMHGTADATVPYSRGIVNPGIPIQYIDGSRMVYERALCVGVQDNFYTWLSAPHVPYNGPSTNQLAYMDTTVNFVRDYLLQRLNITCTALQLPNTAHGAATLYPYTGVCSTGPGTCIAGIKAVSANLLQEVYPNPSENEIKVVFANSNDTHTLQVTDLSGRIVKSAVTTQSTYTLEKSNINPGVYFLKVSNKQGEASVQKIIFY